MKKNTQQFIVILSLCLFLANCQSPKTITVGSKRFTESYVLAEITKKLLENYGYTVAHKQGLGGTIISWQALKNGEIDVYPEYSGTLTEAILKVPPNTPNAEIVKQLATHNIGITKSLGFNNTYAIAVKRELAEQLNLHQISDLQNHPNLRLGLTHEFINRRDGWKALTKFYNLNLPNTLGLEHALAYTALLQNEIDVIDAYSTDAKLAEYDLVVLEDDRQFFPEYKSLFLYRLDIEPDVLNLLKNMVGTINEAEMIRLNATAEKSTDYAFAASLYFKDATEVITPKTFWDAELTGWVFRHLQLVFFSLSLAIFLGIPLGIRAGTPGAFSQIILGVTGIIQTIPSLALLALFAAVPFLGIGSTSAITALFLYSLLPIVRNTATGLQNIPKSLIEASIVIGLSPKERLFQIYLPLASRTILAGIKTSAIINIGTATLAALIGAGGLGEPIISGLALNDSSTILKGAIPAALLAILVEIGFNGLDKVIIPKGLTLKTEKV